MRARITRELIERKGFTIVAAEADWPDAAQINNYVGGEDAATSGTDTPFSRFPTWMWANTEVLDFVAWLRRHNAGSNVSEPRPGFYGLDLYSLGASIEAVLEYLEEVDSKMERQSHYFRASLPHQFDEYVWFDKTRAVTPLNQEHAEGMPETCPFGV